MFKKVYTLEEFLHPIEKPKKTHIPFVSGLTIPAVLASAIRANAEGNTNETTVAVVAQADVYDKVITAFDPIITMLQAFAYPIATLVVLGGALFIMIGNKEKGFGLMQGAGLGYILVQMTPLFLSILQNSVKAVA